MFENYWTIEQIHLKKWILLHVKIIGLVVENICGLEKWKLVCLLLLYLRKYSQSSFVVLLHWDILSCFCFLLGRKDIKNFEHLGIPEVLLSRLFGACILAGLGSYSFCCLCCQMNNLGRVWLPLLLLKSNGLLYPIFIWAFFLIKVFYHFVSFESWLCYKSFPMYYLLYFSTSQFYDKFWIVIVNMP